VNDTLWPGDNAARARFSTLTSALGGEPASGYAKAMLARLASWTAKEDIDLLGKLINDRVAGERARADRYRDLLAEVAHRLDPSQPSTTAAAYVELPAAVAAMIREAVRETDG
jgi:hypothetical protein